MMVPGIESVPHLAPEDPPMARLRRIGVIDVGSNSVRLVVFDGVARSPAYFYNEKVLCGLGTGLGETGRLSPEGWEKARAALHRFAGLAGQMQLSGLITVGTAAVREAQDGPLFCDMIEAETGLQIQVASGAEEARLAAKGVLLGWPDAEGLVCDMGGSSMELAHVGGAAVRDCATAPLGPLALAGLDGESKRQKYIRREVKALRKAVPGPALRLFLVGGSWRAIARLDMHRRNYPLTVLHGYEPPTGALLETLDWIPRQDPAALSALTGTSVARMALIPLVAPVLAELIGRVAPEAVAVSAYGLREGLLYRQMSERTRALDPLIEVCRQMEARSARVPGFGMALYRWVLPLYPDAPEAELRLVRAACLLHDVTWRGHPDYRAEMCFALVTRANIGGINHAERVFLGLALLNRYKSSSPEAIVARYLAILPDARAEAAAVLGRAMRLGSMLSGSTVAVLAQSALEPAQGRLTLRLRGQARKCFGEAVDRRFRALSGRLGVEAQLVLE
jgi:exopolyphosphatase / guanosine-5'-triphosphate,3'-diphosphate pyrophosphatase